MAKPYQSHEQRTAADYRQIGLHAVRLTKIEQATPNVKTIQLNLEDKSHGLEFLPGQWLDVFVPGIDKAGGFTITSSPIQSKPRHHKDSEEAFLELAIQRSPRNPPAAWLWKPETQIIDSQLLIRVGGSFTYPPPKTSADEIRRVLFIAGGVGINPFMSMIRHIDLSQQWPEKITLLYGSKGGSTTDQAKENILFDSELIQIASHESRFSYESYSTGNASSSQHPDRRNRRISIDDVDRVLGPVETRASTVTYVCGPQAMTDEFIASINRLKGVSEKRVLCEKWW